MTAELVLDMPEDEYHKLPGLSQSIAKVLIERSPLHAKTLRGMPPSRLMDRGSIMHKLVLGRGRAFEVLRFDSYRTNAAKDAREEARRRGLIPILEEEFADASEASEAIRVGLAERGVVLDGASEVSVRWEEASSYGPVPCRGRFDHVWLDDGVILDLKIVGRADPKSIERSAENLGYAIQSTAYTSALEKLRPGLVGRVRFLFAFCEPEAPHDINLCEPSGAFRELGERRWRRAVETWAVCTKTDVWPGYGSGVNRISPPPWAMAQEEQA